MSISLQDVLSAIDKRITFIMTAAPHGTTFIKNCPFQLKKDGVYARDGSDGSDGGFGRVDEKSNTVSSAATSPEWIVPRVWHILGSNRMYHAKPFEELPILANTSEMWTMSIIGRCIETKIAARYPKLKTVETSNLSNIPDGKTYVIGENWIFLLLPMGEDDIRLHILHDSYTLWTHSKPTPIHT
jgi:hypothetical protein